MTTACVRQTRKNHLCKSEREVDPSDEICGTPHVTFLVSKSKPLIDTYCFRSLKYDFNRSFMLPRRPYALIFLQRRTVLNAFSR